MPGLILATFLTDEQLERRSGVANAKKVVAKLPEIYGKMAKNESALASK